SKAGGLLDGFLNTIMPSSTKGQGSSGISRSRSDKDRSQPPDWTLAAQRAIAQLANMILAGQAVEDDALVYALDVIVNATRAELLIPAQWGGAERDLQAWERGYIMELCSHLYFLLFNDNRRVSEKAMRALRELLLSSHCRPVAEKLLHVTPSVPGEQQQSDSRQADGFGLLREGDWGSDMAGGQTSVEFQLWLGGLDEAARAVLEDELTRVTIKPEATRQGAMVDALASCHSRQHHICRRYGLTAEAAEKSMASKARLTQRGIRNMLEQEIRRQVKWQQNRLDQAKFAARTWSDARRRALGSGLLNAGSLSGGWESEWATVPAAMQPVTTGDLHLDFTEGPCRMRKKLFRGEHVLEVLAPRRDLVSGLRSLPPRPQTGSRQAFISQQVPAGRTRTRGSTHDGQDGSLLATESEAWSIASMSEMEDEGLSDVGEADAEAEPEGEGESEQLEQGEGKATVLAGEAGALQSSAQSALVSQSSVEAKEKGGDSDEEYLSEEDDLVAGVDSKLKPLLQPGDEILKGYNCELVVGMDSRPGILLCCRQKVYMVEAYRIIDSTESEVQDGSRGSQSPLFGSKREHPHERPLLGDVVEVLQQGHVVGLWLDGIAGEGLAPEVEAEGGEIPQIPHACRQWAYDEVVALHRRRFLLRHVAIEVFMGDGQNFLVTLANKATMEEVYLELVKRVKEAKAAAEDGADTALMDMSLLENTSEETLSSLASITRSLSQQKSRNSSTPMTERWVNGHVSNFVYLMHLNTLAGRSYNDLTQYPVFPWVLSDYTSEEIDLRDPKAYRDLSKPMGALNPNREREFRDRFEGLRSVQAEDEHAPPPFHYGTHYSSAAVVLYFLIRLQPFATHAVGMQGGRFDHPNRLFHSVKEAWLQSSGATEGQESTQDVKELIPEFFYLPHFLENRNNYKFGPLREDDGHQVDGVELPPWAKGSAKEFIKIHRSALESDYVSANLHRWIDLIFGCLQQGEAAEASCNVFFWLTMEGAVDLETIEDPAQRIALVQQIHEFGQTPTQLFQQPHPKKNTAAKSQVERAKAIGMLRYSHVYEHPEFMEAVAKRAVTSTQSTLLQFSSSGSSSGSSAAQPQLSSLLGCLWGLEDSSGCLPPPEQGVGHLYDVKPQGASSMQCMAVNSGCLLIPPLCREFISFGYIDCSLRLCSAGAAEGGSGEGKLLLTFDLPVGSVGVAAISAEGRILVTGMTTNPVMNVWRLPPTLSRRFKDLPRSPLQHVSTLCTPLQAGPLQAVAVNHAYSAGISVCSVRRVAVLWDIARGVFVKWLLGKPLPGQGRISLHLDHATGSILIGAGAMLFYLDINGELQSEVDVREELQFNGKEKDDDGKTDITAVSMTCAPEWEDGNVVITGHADGGIHMWRMVVTPEGDEGSSRQLKHCASLPHDHTCAVTALHVSADQKKLFSGDFGGTVFAWIH
ncbi:unnamed protein product, partial [Chrysoparadoxa australica]